MIDTIAIFLLGMLLGWATNNLWNKWIFEQLLKRLNVTDCDLNKLTEDLEKEIQEENKPGEDLPELEIRIEQVNGHLYAYSLEDQRFIAQGRDREQLLENLVHNLNQVRVICHESNGAHHITP
jgi:hypothetical protein